MAEAQPTDNPPLEEVHASDQKASAVEQKADDDHSSSDDDADPPTAILPAKQATENTGFSFYNFGYHLIPFHDILDSFFTLRKTYLQHKQKGKTSGSSSASAGGGAGTGAVGSGGSVSGGSRTAGIGGDEDPHPVLLADRKSPSKDRTFDIKDYQRKQEEERLKASSHKISRFRPVEPKWDGTLVPDQELLNTLYRTPQADTSGRVIFSVVREEAKNVTPWKLPERGGRDFPVPTLDQCNPRLQLQILAHMNETILKVEKEFEKSPVITEHDMVVKARMGADLDNLRRQRDKLARYVKKDKKKKGFKPHADSLFDF
eukprot:gene8400-9259_t